MNKGKSRVYNGTTLPKCSLQATVVQHAGACVASELLGQEQGPTATEQQHRGGLTIDSSTNEWGLVRAGQRACDKLRVYQNNSEYPTSREPSLSQNFNFGSHVTCLILGCCQSFVQLPRLKGQLAARQADSAVHMLHYASLSSVY